MGARNMYDVDFYRGDAEVVRNAIVEVLSTSTIIMEPKARKSFVIVNTGSSPITIHFGSKKAVAFEGLVLAVGSSYAESRSNGFEIFTGTITGISHSGTGQLSIIER